MSVCPFNDIYFVVYFLERRQSVEMTTLLLITGKVGCNCM